MKTKDRLAASALSLLRELLIANNISWSNGVQYGGGTINSDQICIGDLEVAITLKGKFEIVDRQTDTSEVFDLATTPVSEVLEVLKSGYLN